MKKNKVILIGLILIICLVSCLLVIRFVLNGHQDQKEDCKYSDFEDIIQEINYVTNYNFSPGKELSLYIPGSFTKNMDYVFVVNDENTENYIVIIKNICDKDLRELQSSLELINSEHKKSEIKHSGIYTYVISSNQKYSAIDGIIRSFSKCY